MPTNRKEHLRYRYGICLKEDCPKCKSKEVQQIPARKDFVCEECNKPLRECPPPKSFRDKYGKTIIGAAIAVIAAVLIGLYIRMSDNKATDAGPTGDGPVTAETDTTSFVRETELIDTAKAATASIVDKTPSDTTDTVTQTPHRIPEVPKTGTPKTTPSVKVPFGIYSGPANGLDGEIKVTRRYTLDLRNAAHESIELLPGDVITLTKFKNGELVGGYWHRGSESRTFHR